MRSIDSPNLPQSRLAGLAERQQTSNNSRTSRRTDNPFSSALKQAASRQTLAASGAARQNLAAAAPPATTSSSLPPRTNPFMPLLPGQTDAGPQASYVLPAAAPAAAPAAGTPEAALEVLREALRKANIEPSGLNLYYEEQVVGYPGGSYVNRQVTCDLGSGNKESYDVGLMLKNPWLTAFEISRQTGRRA